MAKNKFPNCKNISEDEGLLFIEILSEDDDITVEKVKSFLECIDEALTIQKHQSIYNRFKGKRLSKIGAKEIIYERVCRIEI